MRVAYSYRRFSDPKQEKGDSIRRQTALRDNYIKRHNLTLDTSLRLQDLGISARYGKHAEEGALAGFLEAIKLGKIAKGSVLIVENLDRLSREQVTDALMRFISILNAGVHIVTLDPEREYTRASVSDIAGLLEPIVVMQRAWEESERKSHRGRAAWDNKRANLDVKKLTGRIPAWLALSKDKRSFEVIPDRLAMVRLIFNLSLQGMGVGAIVRKLNSERVPNIGRVAVWQDSAVKKILHNRAVLGEFQPHILVEGKRVSHGEPIKDYYPPVISEDEFYRVQQSLNKKSSVRGPLGKKVANLFTGLMRDALDGTPVRFVDKGAKARDGGQLVSAGALLKLPGSKYLAFPYDVFEAAFLSMVRELKPSDFIKGNIQVDDLGALAGRLSEIDHKIETIKSRIELETDFEPLLDVLARLQKQRATTKAAIETTKITHSNHRGESLGELQSLAAMISQANEDDRFELRAKMRGRIKALVDEIWFHCWEDERNQVRYAEAQVHYWDGRIRRFITGHSKKKGYKPFEVQIEAEPVSEEVFKTRCPTSSDLRNQKMKR